MTRPADMRRADSKTAGQRYGTAGRFGVCHLRMGTNVYMGLRLLGMLAWWHQPHTHTHTHTHTTHNFLSLSLCSVSPMRLTDLNVVVRVVFPVDLVLVVLILVVIAAVDLGSTWVALTRGRLEPVQPIQHLTVSGGRTDGRTNGRRGGVCVCACVCCTWKSVFCLPGVLSCSSSRHCTHAVPCGHGSRAMHHTHTHTHARGPVQCSQCILPVGVCQSVSQSVMCVCEVGYYPYEVLFLDDVLHVEGVEDRLHQSPRRRYADVTQLYTCHNGHNGWTDTLQREMDMRV